MALFKDVYTREFYEGFSSALKEIAPRFNRIAFMDEVLSGGFDQMEYKQRMRHTTLILNKNFPYAFSEAAALLTQFTKSLIDKGHDINWVAYMFLPDYIELFGIDDLDISAKAFEEITQFVSCEFAVRPFILRYRDKMIDYMKQWSKHDNDMVRRLSSEGCRPRLPWAMALPFLKDNPTPIMPILENLREDPNKIVRRSVANNLNDIAKDNPDMVIEIARKWHGKCKHTDEIVKHACRTLLKKGNPEILQLYGLDYNKIKTGNLKIYTKEINVGESVSFSFDVENLLPTEQVIRLEYGLYFQKANGTLSRKVFKISERVMKPSECLTITRKHSFKLITTMKFYPGEHAVSVIVNGKEFEKEGFVLIYL